MDFHRSLPCCLLLLCFRAIGMAEVPDPSQFTISEWASNGMTQDPVALAFDHQGRLYLVESARRTTVDIDIRSHRDWLLRDLANDDFDSMRDFFRREMAPELSAKNSVWLEDRNQDGSHDFRDLRTISERIRLLEDTNGDGRADRSTVYAENFRDEFTGVAAGVLPINGDVLMTVYPDLWRLRDLDGDGQADGRVSMFRGFGVHAAFDGHDLHGLTIGPEGKVYFSCGDNGFSIINQEGRRLHHPNTGGVLRMNPDGSDLEVFATGLRNVQEFDFDAYGNMFGVDNDGDLEDERERAVYIAEGSDSGWRLNWQFRSPGWAKHNGGLTYNPWIAEGMWKPQHADQPAFITPPMQNYSVGPGGFKFNPGTALNEAYRDFFFCVQFPVQQITAFRTQPRGAGFKMVDEHLFHGGLMVSSLNFGPDGGLYLADWVGKWQPNGEGVVYRLDASERAQSTERLQVKQLLHDGLSSHSPKSLTNLLGHPDRRIRQLAQFELVHRKKGHRLYELLADDTQPQLARIHAAWGLIQLNDEKQRKWLGNRLPWTDADPQVRQQCARVGGELRLKDSAPHLVQLLSDDVALVRSHAAIALGKVGSDDARSALLALASSNADEDPFLRHAAVMGLAGSSTAASLAQLHQHDSKSVRLAAVLALRRQQSPDVIAYLHDPHVQVLREAVRAIHDDFSIPAALPAVASLLKAPYPLDEPTLRRILSANLRVGERTCAERLVQYALQPASSPDDVALRIEALRCLADWRRSPLVDRVEGRIRKSKRAVPEAGQQVLLEHLEALVSSPTAELLTEVTRIARTLSLPISGELLQQWIASPQRATATRVAALQLLEQQQPSNLGDILRDLLDASDPELTPLQRAAMTAYAKQAPADALRRVDWSAPQGTRQFFISLLPKLELDAADRQLATRLHQLTGHDATALDVVAAAKSRDSEHYAAALAQFEADAAEHPWGMYQYAIEGGDAQRGEALYRGHVTAQCIRCHDAGGLGKQAGPVLAGLATRMTKRDLLESLVQPSAKIAKGFESTTVLQDDGQVTSGTIVREDDRHLEIGTPQGKLVIVDKDTIEERLPQTQSAMPEMMKVLTPTEVRDLVAYLATLR